MDWPYEGFLEIREAREGEKQESEMMQKGFSPAFIAACRAKAAGVLN
jgi:hypothetical protein